MSERAVSQFCEGLARRFWTRGPRDDWSEIFVDTSGKEIVKLPYRAGNFSEVLCPIGGKTAQNRYGYCDRKGRVVIKPQFERAEKFSEGLAAVTKNGKVGYIDKTGKNCHCAAVCLGLRLLRGVAAVVPFTNDGSKPELKLWGEASGKYFARQRINWIEPESRSD